MGDTTRDPDRYRQDPARVASDEFQPRWVAYSAAHGRTPAEQLEHDRQRWPGGSMCGFIIWTHRTSTDWRTRNGIPEHVPLTPEQDMEAAA